MVLYPSLAVIMTASGERLSEFVLSGTRSYAVPEEITALSIFIGKQAVVITLRCATLHCAALPQVHA